MRIKVRATILRETGEHWVKEDSVEMEIHDLIDYLVLKYVTKGSRLQALPAKFVTEMSREGERIDREKIL